MSDLNGVWGGKGKKAKQLQNQKNPKSTLPSTPSQSEVLIARHHNCKRHYFCIHIMIHQHAATIMFKTRAVKLPK